jgi:hypothetical protein
MNLLTVKKHDLSASSLRRQIEKAMLKLALRICNSLLLLPFMYL